MADEEPEVVEVSDEDEQAAVRAENAREYPDALPEPAEAATVDEMLKVLEVLELAVRNVDVDYSHKGNLGHAKAFGRLQSKIAVLRTQAMSFKWSPEFSKVLQHARYIRVLPILPGASSNVPKHRLRRQAECCQVCGTEEHACEYVFELLGSPCARGPECTEHGPGTLSRCPPDAANVAFERVLYEDACIAEEQDRLKSKHDPAWSKRPPPGYLGMFAVGRTCLQRVRLVMWAQSFLLNEALYSNEALSRMAPEAYSRLPDGSLRIPTATESRAKACLHRIERAESLLRAGSGAGVGSSMAVPDSYTGYPRAIWDRVVEWNKMAREHAPDTGLLPQVERGVALMDHAAGRGRSNEWDFVQCFKAYKDDREGEQYTGSSASEEDSEDGDWSESGSASSEEEEDDEVASEDDSEPGRKRRRPPSGPRKKRATRKKRARRNHHHKGKKRQREAPHGSGGVPRKRRKRRSPSREEDEGQGDVGGAAPTQQAAPAARRPGKRRQNVIYDDDDSGGGASAGAEEQTDPQGFSVRDMEVARALSISERGRPAKSARTDSGAGSSTDPLPPPEEEPEAEAEAEEEDDAAPAAAAHDEERPASPSNDDDDDDDVAGNAVVAAGQARVVAQMIANAHAEAAAAIAAAMVRTAEAAQLAREVRRAQARYERDRLAAERLIAQFELEGMGVRAPALLLTASA